jgi:hypothetical protein
VGWVLLRLLYRRVKRMGLIWTDVMREEDVGTGRAALGTLMMVTGAVGGWTVGMLTSAGAGGRLGMPGFSQEGGDAGVIGTVAPFIVLLLLSLLLCRARPELFGDRDDA